MTLSLRNSINLVIAEVDIYTKTEQRTFYIDIRSSIDINNYSQLLLKINVSALQQSMITDFHNISQLKEWLWDVYFCGEQNDPKEIYNVIKEVKEKLSLIAKRYDLYLIED